MLDLRQRWADPGLAVRLGFDDHDRVELASAIAAVDDHDLGAITIMVDRLLSRIGEFEPREDPAPMNAPDHRAGVLPMLALLATAPEVAAFHTSRGVSAGVSSATLADLGRQVGVHRLTYGEFGLHTQGWLELVWSGALYELGRLQFNLQLEPDRGWVLSTHIPRNGPLTPDGVDASLAAAPVFFAEHFPDYPVHDIQCVSWLLDPALSTLLPDSNLAAFQRRWQPSGSAVPADEDVLFFVFSRRGPVDVAALPTDTALRRVVVQRLAAGEHWSMVRGRLPR